MSIELKPLLFIPKQGSEVKTNLHILDFPREWIDSIKTIYEQNLGREKVTLPAKSLNAAVIALFPEVVTVTAEKYFAKGNGWIISTKEIDTSLIFNIIKAWINEEIFKDINKDKVENVVSKMKVNELKWSIKDINIFQDNKFKNGTSKPENEYFNAAPEYFCNKLCNMNSSFTLSGITLNFKRCGTAEMMSWPPEVYTYKDKKYYYSIAIKFSIQTIPFYSSPVILMNVSTRRFVSENLISESGYIKLPWENDTSVFLSTKTYWYDEKQTSGFTRANLKVDFKGPEIIWKDKLSKIFNSLDLNSRLPEAQELSVDPLKYLESNREVNIVISNSNFTKDNHLVGIGVSMKDLKEICNQISSKLTELKKIDNIKRVSKKFRSTELLNKPIEINRESLAKIVGQKLKLEIRYDTDEIKEALQAAIIKIFGLKDIENNNGIYFTPELEVSLEVLPIGSKIASTLEGKSGHNDRVKYINSAILEAEIPTGTIIELKGKSEWKKGDPKGAIREGFGKTGRVTQFITPNAKKDNEKIKDNITLRAENAVWDLIRQLGYITCEPELKIIKGNIPEQMSIFGLWMIRNNGNDMRKQIAFPVAVYMNSNSCEIKIKCPLFNKWLNYREALLEICKQNNLFKVKGETKSKFKLNREEVNMFIRRFMNEISEVGPALLLMDSTNIRSYWGWVADKNMDKEEIWVGKPEEKLDMSKFKDLRIIKTRSGYEVPTYYGEENEVTKYTGGLFEPFEGVFWSLARKPVTMKSSKLGRADGARIETPNKDFKFQNLVEITPIYVQEDDDIYGWAYVVHKMRVMLFYYNDFTILPAPLHLAKKIEEYIWQIE
ncbi:MAG: hypothetical protein K0R54_3589 [Clostridiaceae bacterium]|jgi:hypothetical protein|nr:hypothetical protein [Clostridiaceae bacterium]